MTTVGTVLSYSLYQNEANDSSSDGFWRTVTT